MLDVNLTGTFLMCQAAIPALLERRRGHRQRGLHRRARGPPVGGGLLGVQGRRARPHPHPRHRVRQAGPAGQRRVPRRRSTPPSPVPSTCPRAPTASCSTGSCRRCGMGDPSRGGGRHRLPRLRRRQARQRRRPPHRRRHPLLTADGCEFCFSATFSQPDELVPLARPATRTAGARSRCPTTSSTRSRPARPTRTPRTASVGGRWAPRGPTRGSRSGTSPRSPTGSGSSPPSTSSPPAPRSTWPSRSAPRRCCPATGSSSASAWGGWRRSSTPWGCRSPGGASGPTRCSR